MTLVVAGLLAGCGPSFDSDDETPAGSTEGDDAATRGGEPSDSEGDADAELGDPWTVTPAEVSSFALVGDALLAVTREESDDGYAYTLSGFEPDGSPLFTHPETTLVLHTASDQVAVGSRHNEAGLVALDAFGPDGEVLWSREETRVLRDLTVGDSLYVAQLASDDDQYTLEVGSITSGDVLWEQAIASRPHVASSGDSVLIQPEGGQPVELYDGQGEPVAGSPFEAGPRLLRGATTVDGALVFALQSYGPDGDYATVVLYRVDEGGGTTELHTADGGFAGLEGDGGDALLIATSFPGLATPVTLERLTGDTVSWTEQLLSVGTTQAVMGPSMLVLQSEEGVSVYPR